MLKKLIIIFLVVLSGIFYYNLTGKVVYEKINAEVLRVIDGDTIDTNIGKVRFKGINTPEKSMFFYEESTEFLRSTLENKTVELESYGADKYGRILAYVFYKGKNINEEILKKGFGTLYYYEKDSYYDKLKKAEEFARINEIGLWKKSFDFYCLELVELKYYEDSERCTNNEFLILKNHCQKELNILVKDDATHIYREKILSNSVFSKNFSCIWNDEGDSLFIWDEKGLLLFYRY
jgi:endonuclease YncB( thermonuclease family)